ncbi:hypothetical protein BKA08_001293 [Nocardioides marinisabuli]|uniref:Apea-like HEPN domain-containing protein n=1 Tax=Nocardioides marinisabuli TaxID=419476 RepID=A0A7Y9JQ34_9ACTN|nr:hypothetical protein [Nocardioides marinisabuli]NYD57055.1 hypothetical protein [Nocardioides marinisabuli]
MVALKCELSPVVFAELYQQLLSSGRDLRESVELRLADLGYDLEDLQSWAELYRANWQAQLPYLNADTAGDFACSEEHAIVASWLLAGLRNHSDSSALSYALDTAVQQHTLGTTGLEGTPRPLSLLPVIRGWTLGAVAPTSVPNLPMVLARQPDDEAIAAAYQGLIEHVLHLDVAAEHPWPELMGSAIYVRAGGLAGALRPPPPPPPNHGLSWSIEKLMGESQRQISSSILSRLRSNWNGWVERRNVLTHVRLDEGMGSATFSAATALVRTWDDVETTLLAITHFVCQEVSMELFEPPLPAAVAKDPWRRYLKRELEDAWWMSA